MVMVGDDNEMDRTIVVQDDDEHHNPFHFHHHHSLRLLMTMKMMIYFVRNIDNEVVGQDFADVLLGSYANQQNWLGME
jgi:hypothetical protein